MITFFIMFLVGWANMTLGDGKELGPRCGELRPLLLGNEHRLAVRVYYEDTDFSGFVYHARYLQFLERGRTEFLRAMGLENAALAAWDPPLFFAVHHMDITFHRGARMDDELLVRTQFTRMRGARITVWQRIERGGEPLCTARVSVACMSADGRAVRASAALRSALAPHLADGQEQ